MNSPNPAEENPVNPGQRTESASELALFFTALMFYTRLPCPTWTPHSDSALNKATQYFPLIGWIVGAIAAAVFWLAAGYFSVLTAALLATAATILVTGAFHEDGFADTCDGFGGGWTKSRILEIMKDSRIGVFGALGLGMLVAIKLSLIQDYFRSFSTIEGGISMLLFFINAHTLSRFMATSCVYFGTYARSNDDVGAKAKPLAKSFEGKRYLLASTMALIPILLWFLLSGKAALLLIPIVMAIVTWRLLRYVERWIEGYTGDCLGAVQQITEVVFYLAVVVVV